MKKSEFWVKKSDFWVKRHPIIFNHMYTGLYIYHLYTSNK